MISFRARRFLPAARFFAVGVATLLAASTSLALPFSADAVSSPASVAVASTPLKQLTATPTPRVAGTPSVSKTLTAVPGTWAPAPVTLRYQWMRGGASIAGATSATYVLTNADAAHTITVQVTGAKSGYTSVSKTSAPTATVTGGVLGVVRPTLSGSPAVGQKLTASAGAWSPAPVTLSYAWLRDGVVIAGATSSYHTLTTADAGHSIAVRVTGTKPSFTTASATSAAVTVPRALTATPTPAIAGTTPSGSADVGSRLSAVAGTWSPAPVTLTYQWFVTTNPGPESGGTPVTTAIAGATTSTFTVPAADSGLILSVAVTGSKAGFASVTKTSRLIPVSSPS